MKKKNLLQLDKQFIQAAFHNYGHNYYAKNPAGVSDYNSHKIAGICSFNKAKNWPSGVKLGAKKPKVGKMWGQV